MVTQHITHRSIFPHEEHFYQAMADHYAERVLANPDNPLLRASARHYKTILSTRRISTVQTEEVPEPISGRTILHATAIDHHV